MNIDLLNQRALALYETGDLERSEQIFNEIISCEPTHLGSLIYLGRIAARKSLISQACNWLAQAADHKSADAQVHYEYACFLEVQSVSAQDLGSALESYKRACEMDLNHHAAFFNAANIHKRLGEFEEALQAYNAAILVHTQNPYYFNNRGDLLLNSRIFFLALEDFERSIELEPTVAYFHNNRGNALKELGQYDKSTDAFKRALSIEPQSSLTYNNLGSLFLERELWDMALACFEMSSNIEPGFFYALYNKGLLFQRFNRLDKAVACYEKALLINPISLDVKWNITIIQLLSGDLKRGLIGYELRHRFAENLIHLPQTNKPLLERGLEAEKILIWNEHGVGNEIFFASFLRHPLLASKKITAKFDPRLLPILRTSFKCLPNIRFVGDWEEIADADYDAHLGIASLPQYLGVDADQAKLWREPYLVTLDEMIGAKIKQTLRTAPGKLSSDMPNKGNPNEVKNKLVIGISWKSVNKKTGRRRSIELGQLLSIFKDLPVELVNLQYGQVQGEIDHFQRSLQNTATSSTIVSPAGSNTNIADFKIHQFSEIDNFGNIAGLAELIKACDLVVSIDNSTLHLASALGRPTCALLSFTPDWRWFLNRSDSPWYKNTKLYRQFKNGNWEHPLTQLRADLERAVQTM